MTPLPSRRSQLILAAALVIGLAARLPGVFWGANFPFGWFGHHVDEYTHLVNAETLISPQLPPRWPPAAYPKGLAAHVAVPFVAVRAVQGQVMADLPPVQAIVTVGRIVSVLYGLGTIALFFFFGRRLHSDPRVAEASALILALGGLHVTQSHFFVADVPVVFWSSLGCFAIMWGIDRAEHDDGRMVAAAAFCLGVALGIKLMVAAIPSLVLLALWKRPRVFRLVIALVFGVAGFVLVNIDSYSLKEIARTLANTGGAHLKSLSRVRGAVIYAIQLPALLSAPVVGLAAFGVIRGMLRWRQSRDRALKRVWMLAVLLPNVLMAAIVILGPNNFPRHLVPFVPWAALLAGYGLVAVADAMPRLGLPKAAPAALLFIYLAVFVFDGERVFIQEPRNAAAHWLRANVPAGSDIWWQGHGGVGGFTPVVFPRGGRPGVLVMELHRANSYLSGMGWKNSMPSNLDDVHGVTSQKELEAFQAVFRGTTEYREVARFQEGYFMPEFLIVDSLLGNRARNYVAEVVIFRK